MESIDPATYPGTNSVFVNLFNESDFHKFRELEKNWSAIRSAELYRDPALIPLTYDSRHLLRIHQYLFQDCYAWAGKIRAYDTAKGRWDRLGGDTFTPANQLRKYLRETVDIVREQLDWLKSKRRQEQVGWLSKLLARLNKMHPFPECNGRTGKLFVSYVAMQMGFDFKWSSISPDIYRTLMQRAPKENPNNDKAEVDPDIYPLLAKILGETIYELERKPYIEKPLNE